MTVPLEYELASRKFIEFLVDVRETSGLWSTHVSYTMVEGVFRVFRRRVSVEQAIRFSNVLPICLRALFVSDWDMSEPAKDFEDFETMNAEVRALRAQHNFATDQAIQHVATALRRYVSEEEFNRVLAEISPEALAFWSMQDS
ncbi:MULTISPECIES: DUF2267 domain-containing protein [unclassified Marinobacter]|uniref:DUF2267 domain-containing protein n=1 Tax=unclassified Marinobacter TaxID=83889 RepID=UPI001926C0B6|nr:MULTISPECIES: DUF2267 domain-containing protein [unclassified Marinobacter]MBL3827200.1 DUF2267 domain-containing protein [Marinobacter sp. MC3]MBL3895710.1 DUF2267 domain-containing protein [Marinobacter sp. MW3]